MYISECSSSSMWKNDHPKRVCNKNGQACFDSGTRIVLQIWFNLSSGLSSLQDLGCCCIWSNTLGLLSSAFGCLRLLIAWWCHSLAWLQWVIVWVILDHRSNSIVFRPFLQFAVALVSPMTSIIFTHRHHNDNHQFILVFPFSDWKQGKTTWQLCHQSTGTHSFLTFTRTSSGSKNILQNLKSILYCRCWKNSSVADETSRKIHGWLQKVRLLVLPVVIAFNRLIPMHAVLISNIFHLKIL